VLIRKGDEKKDQLIFFFITIF